MADLILYNEYRILKLIYNYNKIKNLTVKILSLNNSLMTKIIITNRLKYKI